MGEPNRISNGSSLSTASTPPPPPPPPTPGRNTLIQPTASKKRHRTKVFRVIKSVFRTFPVMPPTCKFPSLPGGRLPDSGHRVCGTLFGYRKGRVILSIQENPKTLPTLVVELGMQTNVLQKEMSNGLVRIALECEKRPDKDNKIKLLEEPLWSFFCNAKSYGYGRKRDATDEDLHVMELLKAVSMGAGVLPAANREMEGPDNEMAYLRAHFDRVVGSRDTETLYMLSPDGNNGPELSIFFVRI